MKETKMITHQISKFIHICLSAVFILFLMSSIGAAGTEKEKNAAWNQYSEDFPNGFERGTIKLSMGYSMENPASHRAQLFATRFEYLLTDHFGLKGDLGYALVTKDAGYKFIPATLGGAIHLFPRSVFDLYVGGIGGYAYIQPKGESAGLFARTGAYVGCGVYYLGMFFIELEGRYCVTQYSKRINQNLNSPTINFQLGFYL
jgi:hypothetical protein